MPQPGLHAFVGPSPLFAAQVPPAVLVAGEAVHVQVIEASAGATAGVQVGTGMATTSSKSAK